LQAEGGDGLRDAARLVEVDRLRPALGHSAESATARAQVAQHHEGGGLVVPAFPDVGAVRALADRVQIERSRQTLERVEILPYRGARLQPVRLGRWRRAHRRNLNQVHHRSIVAGRTCGNGDCPPKRRPPTAPVGRGGQSRMETNYRDCNCGSCSPRPRSVTRTECCRRNVSSVSAGSTICLLPVNAEPAVPAPPPASAPNAAPLPPPAKPPMSAPSPAPPPMNAALRLPLPFSA